MTGLILHGYFRSSAAWRVRIALHLKGVAFDQRPHHLRRGEQRDPGYLALNPQGLVPALQVEDGVVLTQSLAIIEYLDRRYPAPGFLPESPAARAQAQAVALAVACDVHPLQNLRVLDRLRGLGQTEDEVQAWARGVIEEGLDACERLLPRARGAFAFGERPGLADICLVPQLANARRFAAELRWPRLLEIEAAASAHPAFQAAAPERQPDME